MLGIPKTRMHAHAQEIMLFTYCSMKNAAHPAGIMDYTCAKTDRFLFQHQGSHCASNMLLLQNLNNVNQFKMLLIYIVNITLL